MKVVYSDRQISDPGDQPIAKKGFVASPSARKPRELAAFLTASKLPVEFVEPVALTSTDFKRCHSAEYVDGVMSLRTQNGFGTISQSVVDSLPYTNGAMYTAAKLATVDSPTCALVSGFHHAGYQEWQKFGWFCTFNGLLVAAAKLIEEDHIGTVGILDCDMHWGNGTEDILRHLPTLHRSVKHISFGQHHSNPASADTYLDWLRPTGIVSTIFAAAKVGIIIYQAGADVHVDDPYGGVLTTAQMYERDLRVFRLAKLLGVPIVWNLAGGYQVDADGSIGKVLELHTNTFRACQEVYG